MKFKVLLHIPERERFEAALIQAKNFILAKENEKITGVLLNSDGVKILDDLKHFKIPINRIPNGGKTLPSGIVAIVEWQMQGFVYIRA